jgi:hypothetical protein
MAYLSIEGLNKSVIARIKRIARNTVDRWLGRAAGFCRRFSHRKTTGFTVTELQADEIRMIVGGKEQPIWIFAVIFDQVPSKWRAEGAVSTHAMEVLYVF